MNREELKKFINELLKRERLDHISILIKNRYNNIYSDVIEITNYLNGNIKKFTERIYHIINDLNLKPKCKFVGCEKYVLFKSINQGYAEYCKNHIRYSNNLIDGLNNFFKNKDRVKEAVNKRKKTSNILYNADNPSKSDIIKNKISVKNKNNYELRKEEILNKREKTSLIKYNAKSSSGNELIKNKMRNSNLLRSYNLLFSSDRLKNKVIPLFTFEEFKGSINYSNNYKFKCLKCGEIFEDTLYGGKIPRCFSCYPIFQFQSKKEKEIRDWLLKLIEVNNNRLFNKKYELDIFVPSKNIGIEFNGLYWHSEINGKKDKNYHLNKSNFFKEKNIKVIHVFEDEWDDKENIVKSIILSKLGLIGNKIYARNCKIKEVENYKSELFLFDNHLQGEINSEINIGLYYNNELVSLMSFGKSRFNKNYDWELTRFCNKIYINVIGGASKLLNYFRNNYKGSIITYADLRYSDGNLYEKLGFKFLHQSSPNYYYIDKTFKNRINRMKFQKHKLQKKIEDYDPNLTEWQNMQLNGYDRIWDCGNLVYFVEE